MTTASRSRTIFRREGVRLYLGDALARYPRWRTPVVIVSDGPYGLGSYPGDPPTPAGLPEAYHPHVQAWTRYATPQTTLWFWNSELGWATVHPLLVEHGWRYRSCHVWDKGAAHVAGNANSRTLRKFPVVTEVCVQYVRSAEFRVGDVTLDMQAWLRHEWRRTGLPLHRANEACGVANAATRKYLTACHLWYFPPVDMFVRLAAYANEHGDPAGRPYFARDGRQPISAAEWERQRAKFHCEVGVSNVWSEPPVRAPERLKIGSSSAHRNQKPLRLMELILRASSDPGDTVWEPFGGLCTTALAALRLSRRCASAEVMPPYFKAAVKRISTERLHPGRQQALDFGPRE